MKFDAPRAEFSDSRRWQRGFFLYLSFRCNETYRSVRENFDWKILYISRRTSHFVFPSRPHKYQQDLSQFSVSKKTWKFMAMGNSLPTTLFHYNIINLLDTPMNWSWLFLAWRTQTKKVGNKQEPQELPQPSPLFCKSGKQRVRSYDVFSGTK